MKIRRRRHTQAVDADDVGELHRTIVHQAVALQRHAIEVDLLKRTAERLGEEIERIISQPEGSDEHLAATWWRDQYQALVEQVQLHLAAHHPEMDAL